MWLGLTLDELLPEVAPIRGDQRVVECVEGARRRGFPRSKLTSRPLVLEPYLDLLIAHAQGRGKSLFGTLAWHSLHLEHFVEDAGLGFFNTLTLCRGDGGFAAAAAAEREEYAAFFVVGLFLFLSNLVAEVANVHRVALLPLVLF